ncbi:hypothetical protein TREES_T100020887 [Tupaia chinensis]|uniref:Uncharacterized protein n=1 Tax=Tupaia chinensis TaxID=246437 RepID=L9JNU8_TUPCH|nr:hypothetical protein TREES_T100020887 [Tupaia chinensis]
MGTLNPITPIRLQPLQDGLKQAAGQMDKLDTKVGVRPEASRRPGRAPGLFRDERALGYPCRLETVALTRAGAKRALPMSLASWTPAGQVSILCLCKAQVLMGVHARKEPGSLRQLDSLLSLGNQLLTELSDESSLPRPQPLGKRRWPLRYKGGGDNEMDCRRCDSWLFPRLLEI